MDQKKTVFEYDNYRKYLKDTYECLKAEDRKFSFRFFSARAGFKSSNVLKQVIDGKRNIARLSIEKFAKALKLGKEETEFFRHLVLMNQAESSEEKQTHAEQLLKCRLFKKTHPLSGLQFNYLTKWYFVTVRELVNLPGFKEDPEWIAGKLNPRITRDEAEQALDELLKLGLIERNAQGKLVQSNATVSTGDEVLAAAAAAYHREMLKKAAESIDRFSRELRDISAISFGLSSQGVKSLKEMIQKFRKDLLMVAAQDLHPEKIYHLNFQLFPTTDEIKGETK